MPSSKHAGAPEVSLELLREKCAAGIESFAVEKCGRCWQDGDEVGSADGQARVERIVLQCSDADQSGGGAGSQSTIIAKRSACQSSLAGKASRCSPSTAPTVAPVQKEDQRMQSLRVEAAFLLQAESLASEVLDIPKLLHWSCDDDGSNAPTRSLLLMSDLRRDFPLQQSALDKEHAMAGLSWLARFHAAFWHLPTEDPATFVPPLFSCG
eukprot:SAG31_NODE_4061_length_3629_cov_2.873371_1_plen_209_part_10